MTKVLVGIKTAHKLDYYIDQDTRDWLNDHGMRSLDPAARRAAQRDTFLKSLPYDYKFFFGNQLRDTSDPMRRKPFGYVDKTRELPTPKEDEVYLPVMDTYMNVSYKAQQIIRYALKNEYDLLFLIDDDTFVYPKQLWAVISMYDLGNVPYAGAPTNDFHTGNMLFLNRDAMEIVANAKVTHYADDLWIGRLMKARGIFKFSIPTLKSEFGSQYVVDAAAIPQTHSYAALHSCKPQTMRTLFDRGFGFPAVMEEANGNSVSAENSTNTIEPVSATPIVVRAASDVENNELAYGYDILRTFEERTSDPMDGGTTSDSMDSGDQQSVERLPAEEVNEKPQN